MKLDTTNIDDFYPVHMLFHRWPFEIQKSECYLVAADGQADWIIIWGSYSRIIDAERVLKKCKLMYANNPFCQYKIVEVVNDKYLDNADYRWLYRLKGASCDRCGQLFRRLMHYESPYARNGYCPRCYEEVRTACTFDCLVCGDKFVNWNDAPHWDRSICGGCKRTPQYEELRRKHKRAIAHINHEARRSRKMQVLSDFTEEEWRTCLRYWKDCCAVCGRPRGLWHTLAQDHWIPLSKGGAYTASNIIPLCHGLGGCNNSKSNSDAHEWLVAQYKPEGVASIEKRVAQYFEWVQQRNSAPIR